MKQRNNNKSITRTFIHLGDQPTNIDLKDIDILAKYVYNCYGLHTFSGTSFEALRLHQLLNAPNIVPSVPRIGQHVKRACIQSGYLWKLSHLELDIPDPTSWDRKRSSVTAFSYIPLWQACSSPDAHCLLKTCSCTKESCDKCSCKKKWNELYEVLQVWRIKIKKQTLFWELKRFSIGSAYWISQIRTR